MALDQFFDWRGRRVACTRFGSGPPLVFCHGTPFSSEVWRRYAEALSADFTVHLWDMPGYGASSKDPAHAVDLGLQGELFGDLLEHWELDRPHVIAHDFGGVVSLRAHLLHRRSYASLCLVDVVALSPWGTPFFRLVKDSSEVFIALPPAIHRGMLEPYISGASHRGLRDDELATLIAPWLTADGQPAFYRQIAQADEGLTDEIEPLLQSIDIPVHIVWGRDDTWLAVDQAERLREAIPGSTLSVIGEAGHLIQYDAPVALTHELESWLHTVRS
jgi:pimeloyl-ACP methyl ester carboxylesterase